VARKIEAAGNKVMVERITADGYETVEVSMPALITVSNELGRTALLPRSRDCGRQARRADYLEASRYRWSMLLKVGLAGRRVRMVKSFSRLMSANVK